MPSGLGGEKRMLEALMWLVFVLSLPWAVFMAVKLGTYAFFKGRALYYHEEEKLNGKKKS